MMDSQDFCGKLEKEQQIYKRIKLLGAGSFGKVYLVKEIQTDQMFVIKQINIADLAPEEQEVARKQAKILEALDHPNITKFKQVYGTSKMKLNIVMEYADGGDLSSKIQQAKKKNEHFSQALILNWFTQMCLAIKHIHDRKIIHRDLKGQNIFLTDDNQVKIGDFGVSTVLDRTLAKAKTFVGSPYYLSPQIVENRPYSFKTDIWSLGAILFEMCSLNPPFTANNIQFLALKIVKGSYAKIPSRYSADLAQLIKSMLNTNPNQRPSISQILSSPIINRRIKSFLTESQNIKEFSHTVIHNKHILEKEEQKKLRPPPNLQQIQNESQMSYKSNIQAPKYIQNNEGKNQAPHSGNIAKKKPIYRPPIKHNQPPPPVEKDLSDIMKIKASPLEQQAIIKLPKVTPQNERKRPSTPKVVINKKQQVSAVKRENNTCNAFLKKRVSQPKQELEVIKEQTKPKTSQNIPSNVPSNIIKRKCSTDERKPLNNVMKKQDSKKVIQKKPSINKKIVAKPKVKKQEKIESKQKIQMVSEQVKKKEVEQKKKDKGIKKKFIPKQKINKKKSIKEKPEEEAIEEQKFNDSDTYEDEQFEVYQDDEGSEDSLTLSQSKTIHQNCVKSKNFNKMLQEMEMINKIVEEANGVIENIPILGKAMPQLLEMSDSLRQDDSDLQSQLHEKTSTGMMKIQSNLNLECLTDQGQLQNLRIALEQIFGLEDILFAYKIIEEFVLKNGLDFHEEEAIRRITSERKTMDECILRRHFSLIVTVIGIESELHELK